MKQPKRPKAHKVPSMSEFLYYAFIDVRVTMPTYKERKAFEVEDTDTGEKIKKWKVK